MAGSEPAAIYWDSCVLLSWIKNEDTPDRAGIAALVNQIDAVEIKLYISTLLRVEVFTADLDAAIRATYDRFLRRSNVHSIDVDIRVAETARELREYYRADTPELFGKRQLGIADAIHLATAILYKVDEFHTFDTRGRPDRDATEGQRKTIGLLSLDGNVGQHPLRICRPAPRQLTIDTTLTTSKPPETP